MDIASNLLLHLSDYPLFTWKHLLEEVLEGVDLNWTEQMDIRQSIYSQFLNEASSDFKYTLVPQLIDGVITGFIVVFFTDKPVTTKEVQSLFESPYGQLLSIITTVQYFVLVAQDISSEAMAILEEQMWLPIPCKNVTFKVLEKAG